jgi:hypothetical protein
LLKSRVTSREKALSALNTKSSKVRWREQETLPGSREAKCKIENEAAQTDKIVQGHEMTILLGLERITRSEGKEEFMRILMIWKQALAHE